MSASETFFIAFGLNNLQIFNSVGTLVKTFLSLPWDLTNVGDIVYAPLRNNIYITFPGMVPKVLAWDGVTQPGWAISDYAELMVGNQKRTFFYRLSPQGITILPSAQTGAVTVISSAPVFTSSHVGTRIRYVGRQILITGFISPQVVNGTVQEALPGHQNLGVGTDRERRSLSAISSPARRPAPRASSRPSAISASMSSCCRSMPPSSPSATSISAPFRSRPVRPSLVPPEASLSAALVQSTRRPSALRCGMKRS